MIQKISLPRNGYLRHFQTFLNPLSTNSTKWSNGRWLFPSNCLSVFDHFVGLALQGLNFFGKPFLKNSRLKA